MAKTKKKRTKRYAGSGAATRTPVIRRYDAVERTRAGQWLHERKGRLKIFGVLAAAIGILTLVVSGIASLLH